MGVSDSKKIAAFASTTVPTIQRKVRGRRIPFASAIAPRAATTQSPGSIEKM